MCHTDKSYALTFVIVIFAVLLLSPNGKLRNTVLASHTPEPTSVTIVGSLQSEMGCAWDWDPACAGAHLTYDANDDVWRGTWPLPAGNWEYKAALNDSWDENYGLHATPGGANIPLNMAAAGDVKFYYDHKSHWITDSQSSLIVTAPGSYQSELGCLGDWRDWAGGFNLPSLVCSPSLGE